MELYSGGRKQQLDSNENSNIVHGNGSPFDHLSGNNGSSEAAAYRSAADNTIISNSGASSDNNSNSMKAKKQSNYHFLPSIMVTGSRREINSDSDEYVDNETSHYNQRNSHHAAMSSSDEGLLRNVFSSQQHSSITSSSAVSANAGMNNDRIQTNNNVNTSTILPSQQQFKSALGQRIWNNYQSNRQQQQQQQLHNNNNTVTPPFILSQHHHLPSTDFLRLPSKMVRIKRLSSQQQYNDNNNEWVNMDELERQVLQSHLDFETTTSSLLHHDEVATNNNNSIYGNERLSSSSSSLLTSECFSRILQRDSRCGLGMSLREYDGCVYIQALLRLDGSRMEFDNNGGDDDYDFNSNSNNNLSEEDAKSPAYAAGLHPGDRLLGLNGRPFLKGIKVPDLSSASVSSSDHIAADPEDVLRSVGDAISSAKSHLVLHIQRERDGHVVQELLVKLQSKSSRKVPMMQEKKRAMMSSGSNEAMKQPPIPLQQQHYHSPLEQRPKPKPKGPYIHPFAKALADRSIIKHGKDEQLLTQQIRIFTDRT
eukprot:scaffold22202_cov80-Skeletonema_marinoi.AAC.1